MALELSYDELLRYTNDERDKWRRWLQSRPEAMETPLQPGGRFPTVGKLIDHVFLVERRHLQRLTGDPVSESTADGKQRPAALRLRGVGAPGARAVCGADRGRRRDGAADLRRPGGDRVDVATEAHVPHPLHEIRHWAQIALAVRLAGLEPPGEHDLFYSRALR